MSVQLRTMSVQLRTMSVQLRTMSVAQMLQEVVEIVADNIGRTLLLLLSSLFRFKTHKHVHIKQIINYK